MGGGGGGEIEEKGVVGLGWWVGNCGMVHEMVTSIQGEGTHNLNTKDQRFNV